MEKLEEVPAPEVEEPVENVIAPTPSSDDMGEMIEPLGDVTLGEPDLPPTEISGDVVDLEEPVVEEEPTIEEEVIPEPVVEEEEVVEEPIKPVNRPRGWQARNEFIDDAGNVFHKGKYVRHLDND